jgi:hypothetical protein
MSKLTYQNGKFYREGKEVPPEFGNPEQIALLKKIQSQMENGVEASIFIEDFSEYEIHCRFQCPKCFIPNYHKSERFEEYHPTKEDIDDFLEEIGYCDNCGDELTVKRSGKGYVAKAINNDEEE